MPFTSSQVEDKLAHCACWQLRTYLGQGCFCFWCISPSSSSVHVLPCFRGWLLLFHLLWFWVVSHKSGEEDMLYAHDSWVFLTWSRVGYLADKCAGMGWGGSYYFISSLFTLNLTVIYSSGLQTSWNANLPGHVLTVTLHTPNLQTNWDDHKYAKLLSKGSSWARPCARLCSWLRLFALNSTTHIDYCRTLWHKLYGLCLSC